MLGSLIRNSKNTALILVFLALPGTVSAQLNVESGTIDVDLIVAGCNGNLVCEAIIGEDTLSCPVDCPVIIPTTPTTTSGSTSDTNARPGNRRNVVGATSTDTGFSIDMFEVTPGVIGATFSFSSPTQTIASVRIGKTIEYEQLAVAEFGYRTNHYFEVTGLMPSTLYFYEVVVVDADGNLERKKDFFQTKSPLSIPSIERPLLAKPDTIHLHITDGVLSGTWSNPTQKEFTQVQVVRTLDRPARNPADGITVYRGDAGTFRDTGIVPDATYFYTFFAEYESGRIADGVFVEVLYPAETQTNIAEVTQPVFGDEDFGVFSFSYTQENVPSVWEGKELLIAPDLPIEIRLPKEDFFTPLSDVYVEVVAYNQAGEVAERRYQKFTFDTGSYEYATLLDGFDPHQTLLVTLKVLRSDGTFDYVLLKMYVGERSSAEGFFDAGAGQCLGGSTWFVYLKSVLVCTMPWPLIVLCALLIAGYLRFSVLRRISR